MGYGVWNGGCCDGRICERSACNVVGKQIEVFMAEIHTRLNHIATLNQRPIIPVFVGSLNFSQRMAKCVFPESPSGSVLKVVPRAREIWCPEVDGVGRSASDAELL